MPLMSIIIMWALKLASIALTEVMLSSKRKNNTSKKVLFWAVTVCISLCFQYFGVIFGVFNPVPLVILGSIFPLLMIPVRIIFELVLIGMNIERNITSSNNQNESQAYRSNYSSNTQNN